MFAFNNISVIKSIDDVIINYPKSILVSTFAYVENYYNIFPNDTISMPFKAIDINRVLCLLFDANIIDDAYLPHNNILLLSIIDITEWLLLKTNSPLYLKIYKYVDDYLSRFVFEPLYVNMIGIDVMTIRYLLSDNYYNSYIVAIASKSSDNIYKDLSIENKLYNIYGANLKIYYVTIDDNFSNENTFRKYYDECNGIVFFFTTIKLLSYNTFGDTASFDNCHNLDDIKKTNIDDIFNESKVWVDSIPIV